MRFVMIVKADEKYEAGHPPDPALMTAIGELSVNMAEAGILLDQGGLLPSSAGARIEASDGRIAVVDGPFRETNELIGGYAILKAESKAEAVELGSDSCSCTSMYSARRSAGSWRFGSSRTRLRAWTRPVAARLKHVRALRSTRRAQPKCQRNHRGTRMMAFLRVRGHR
jgi:hypothetical protein